MDNTINKLKEIVSGFLPSYFYKKVSYSQEGEDIIIEKIFGNKKRGFYLDIGAFHPFKYSNTYKLYKKGWHGINIEPNREKYEILNKFRKRDINLNLAVSDRDKKLTYYKFLDPALNTFSKSVYKEIVRSKQSKFLGSENIVLKDINNVLKRYVKNSTIDLINIDCEGMTENILKRINLKKYKPSVLILERDNMGKQLNKSSINNYLLNYSYILYSSTSLSFIYKK